MGQQYRAMRRGWSGTPAVDAASSPAYTRRSISGKLQQRPRPFGVQRGPVERASQRRHSTRRWRIEFLETHECRYERHHDGHA